MSPVDSGKTIGEGALIAISGAACVIPDAWELAAQCFKSQCDPGAMWDAGQAWLDSAGQIGDAITAATTINNQIGGSWQGADYEAFVAKNADYIRQMMAAQILAYTTGVAMMTAAVESFVVLVMFAAIGVALAIWAGLIIAATASIIGDLGASEALEADALLFVVECETVTESVSGATAVTDGILAGGIGAILAGDVGFQVATGNPKALAELGVATVEGLGTIVTGMTARVLRDSIAGKAGNPIGRTLSQKILTAVGLDALLHYNPFDYASAPLDPSR